MLRHVLMVEHKFPFLQTVLLLMSILRAVRVMSHLQQEQRAFLDTDVVIVAAARTPLGCFGGAISSLSAVELGGFASTPFFIFY